MSDVIDLLEKLGQDSALRHASRATLDGVLAEARLSPQTRAALASHDQRALETLLGSAKVCCLVYVPPTEEQPEEPQRKQAAACSAPAFARVA